MARSPDPFHLADGDLMRLVDRELPEEEGGRASAHLAGCSECAERLARLRREAQGVAELIGAVDASPDALRRARAWEAVERAGQRERQETVAPRARWFARPALLRAAAGVVLVLGLAAAVEPARAWMIRLVRGIAGRPVPSATAHPQARRVSGGDFVVAAVPRGEIFVIELRAAQRRGTLTLTVEETPSASVRVVGGEAELEVVALPDGWRIENTEASGGDYTVTVPTRLRRVVLRVGRAPEASLSPPDLVVPWTGVLELGRVGPTEAPLPVPR